MKLPTEIFIAIRYLKARKKGFFSVLTTLIAVGGTSLGVAALVITLAIMTGFQTDIRDKILGIQPHIVITRIDGEPFKDYDAVEEKLRENKSVVSYSPFVYKQGLIRGLVSSASTGIILKAIDFEAENNIVNLSKQITVSDMRFDGTRIGEKSIMLGSELAKTLLVTAGDEVVLVFPGNFASIPKMYKFTVSAVIHSGMYDYDSSLGFMDLSEAQRMFAMEGEVSGISVHTDNFDKAIAVAEKLQDSISFPYRAKSWIDLNKNLFSALKLEKIMMFLILGLIILVAAFNIISNLLLLSVQKSKEIGIMSAMGFSKFSIAKIFFYEGMVVGSIGTVLGIIVGTGISLILKYFEIFKLPQGIYYVDRLPVVIMPMDILMVAASAFVITVLAGIYPAYQVSKLDPLEAIRYG
ncbi:MAG: ABC transporter permease [Endomicrobia bacterium]|nr:ABC transporter permease [Endomicrobiia bacterium]MCL2507445.1 ABC transporter permease [Endomicrobiia bacterium]